MDSAQLIGRAPARLSSAELACLSGRWVALEIYTPETVPLKRIASIGASAADCMTALASSGHDPRQFEYMLFQ